MVFSYCHYWKRLSNTISYQYVIINKEQELTIKLLNIEINRLQEQNNLETFQLARNNITFEQEILEIDRISSLYAAINAKDQDIEDLIEICRVFQEKIEESESIIQNFNTKIEKMESEKFSYQE